MNPIEKYFSGERAQCLIGIFIAIDCIILALFLLLQGKTEFYKGMAWPFVVVPFFLLVICAAVVIRTPKDIARVNGFLQQQSEKIQTEEIPRMQKVMQSFRTIKIAEIVLALLGLGMFLFASTPFWRGIGMGLILQGVLMFGFDHFAERRGKIYWEYLQRC